MDYVDLYRIRENAGVFDFELAPDDMAALGALDEGLHTISWQPEPDWF